MVDAANLLHAGTNADILPKGDSARQAIDSLRGYVYQALAAAIAWVDIDDKERLFLEVAEDYATMANEVLEAVQVKDTRSSGSVTLSSRSVHSAVKTFVELTYQNPNLQVELHFFTTSQIGKERRVVDRPAGVAGLKYWGKVAAGADPLPLRTILQGAKFPESVRVFCRDRSDAELRRDLFERIHWDCGRGDSSTLRQELEARLVVIGRDRFSLPAQEAPQLADHLIYQILRKTILQNPMDRCLTRADLYSLIDGVTRISMQRSDVAALAKIVSNPESLSRSLGTAAPIAMSEMGWLIDGNSLPLRQGMISRPVTESEIASALGNHGVCVLVAGSGLGKSVVSRAIAAARAGNYFIADCRHIGIDETRYRLGMLFARIGGLPPSMLILEDLNHLGDARIAIPLARVIEASRRRNREVIITCYRKPDVTALAEISLDQGCFVKCSYFSEEETREVIRQRGGSPDTWGRLAHITGGGGHPQLTHAFVLGVAARGWPINEFDSVIGRGLSSEDTDNTRLVARRSLKSSLPGEARRLLYRLSLTSARFSRPLALTLGQLAPEIPVTGECIDQLIGPWIEDVGSGLYRVSPLVSNLGSEMLHADEQEHIHQTIAVQKLNQHEIDPSELNAIMNHAIAGKSGQSLVKLALGVLQDDLDPPKLAILAEQFLLLRLSRTDVPLYPSDLSVSAALRAAQFRLVMASEKRSRISDVNSALFDEISSMPEGESKNVMQARAILTVLGTAGVANYLEDWVPLLVRLKAIARTNEYLEEFVAHAAGSVDETGRNLFGVLFGIGTTNLVSVERLENVISQLAELDPVDRDLLLTPVNRIFSDYALFVHGPYTCQNRADFDPEDAVIRYQRMAKNTRSWGIRSLSLQCSVAAATVLDKYKSDKEGALLAIEEAVTAMGDDLILERAKARIYFCHGEYTRSLEIFRVIGDQVAHDDPVERAYTLREAAISAAQCGEWSKSENWFLEAQTAADQAPGIDMKTLALGLGADSAAAALEAGNVARAITRLSESVSALTDIDPEATLRAAYCHRLIRHTVLWMHSRVEKNAVMVSGQPIQLEPGTCSNPEPLPAIREHPLGPLDIGWYLLAEAETSAGVDAGIKECLDKRLPQGPIPHMEFRLRLRVIQRDIENLDVVGFSAHFMPYVESAAYSLSSAHRLMKEGSLIEPERGQVPPLDRNEPFDSVVEGVAMGVMMACSICIAFEKRPEKLHQLEHLMHRQLSDSFPGKTLFDHWNGKPNSLGEGMRVIATTIKTLLQQQHVKPYDFWLGGLYFFEWIDQSPFKDALIRRLATWLRCGWKHITAEQGFCLSLPRYNVPRIEAILAQPTNDRRFIAALLFASTDAMGINLEATHRNHLKAVAAGKE